MSSVWIINIFDSHKKWHESYSRCILIKLVGMANLSEMETFFGPYEENQFFLGGVQFLKVFFDT